MKALVTGASSGIGLEMAKYLDSLGYEVILVARNKEKLEELAKTLNNKAYHALTKLFLRDMKRKDKGYILNVASSAAFQSGPLMATYYATKSYVYRLTEAIYYELKKQKSNVHISVLCPGPVDTNFNKVADVKFSVKPLKAKDVAKYAINKMFKNKLLIIPGFGMKLGKLFGRFISDKMQMRIIYRIQKRKIQ